MHVSCRGLRRYGTTPITSGSKWKVTVGLEIHAQLATPHKLFSDAPNQFGGVVNHNLAPFDISLPGSQPRINKHAVLLATRTALAFGCKVNLASKFDRKHYFYPDQPAGYQITQNYEALGHNGSFSVSERDGIDDKDTIYIGVSQVQLEQDTARTTYYDSPPQSLVDLNRNGAPLIEIVTTPSIPSARAAGAALRKIQSILRAVQASDANMEAGGMRCDVNISVTTDEDRHLGPTRRVEIKNLASGRIVTDAVSAESRRQISVLEAGGVVGKETRGYDVENGETFLLRTKESATDYRYMPEPDLPAIKLSQNFLEQCLKNLPELPDAQMNRLTSAPYSLSLKDAKVLLENAKAAAFYEAVLDLVGRQDKNAKIVGNWLIHELFGRQGVMENAGKQINAPTIRQFADLVQGVIDGRLSGLEGKLVLQAMLDGDSSPVADMMRAHCMGQAFSPADLDAIVESLLSKNTMQAERLRSGDVKIKKWFAGQIMKESKGKAKAAEVEARLQNMILASQSKS